MAHTGPRPAQVISLEDFEEVEEGEWKHPCRCGGTYNVAEEDMDAGRHLVGCESCSEVVWVGYELVNDEGGEGK
jgi:diphthamide biosynthesis protein 4